MRPFDSEESGGSTIRRRATPRTLTRDAPLSSARRCPSFAPERSRPAGGGADLKLQISSCPEIHNCFGLIGLSLTRAVPPRDNFANPNHFSVRVRPFRVDRETLEVV